MIRDDDADVIASIKDNFQVGTVSRLAKHGTSNPAIAWTCERVQDLAEIIVPLFDQYPHFCTKKRHEYPIWRCSCSSAYLRLLPDTRIRRGIPDDERLAFHEGVKAIAKIQRLSFADVREETSIIRRLDCSEFGGEHQRRHFPSCQPA